MMGWFRWVVVLPGKDVILKAGQLLLILSVTTLVACMPSGSESEGLEDTLKRFDQHAVRVQGFSRSGETALVIASTVDWVALGQLLEEQGYEWSLGDGRIQTHISLIDAYLDAFASPGSDAAYAAELGEYLASESGRLVDPSGSGNGRISLQAEVAPDEDGVAGYVPPPEYSAMGVDCGPYDHGCNDDENNDPDCAESDCHNDDSDSCDATCQGQKLAAQLEQEFQELSPEAIASIQNAIAEATANGEDLTESEINQIKDKARNIERGKACGACSDAPVELPTGAKVTHAVDGSVPLLALTRTHRISQQSAWSLGAGWHLSLDSRIILGVESPALADDIALHTVSVTGLEEARVQIDALIARFEGYKGRPGYTHSMVVAKLNAILSDLATQREQLISDPEQASDILIAARKKFEELEALKIRSDIRAEANQLAVDPANPAEAILGADVIKWVAPSGSRLSFNDPESGDITPIGGHLNRLHRTELGYRVETPDNLRYMYSADGLLARVEDPQGNHLTIERTNNQARALVDQYGRRWSLQYRSDGRLQTITDPANRTLTYGYDAQRRLTRVTGFDGSVERYEYDYAANPLVITAKFDGEANEAHYDFAQQNQKTVITRQYDEADYHWSYQYDSNNQQTVLTNRNGMAVTNRYNDDYKFTEKVYGGSGQLGSQQFDYDAEGNLRVQYNELNELSSYTYNARGQVESMTDGEGRTTHYTRDTAGRILTETDPAGNTTVYRRDVSGQIDTIEFPDGTRIDETWQNGLLKERIDQDDNITRWAYDSNGFPERIDYFGPVIGDDDDAFRLMTHDAIGRVQTLTEGSNTTPESDWRVTQYFYYDAATGRDLDQPVRIIDPDGREALYRYDGNNQIIYQRDFSGVETHFQYTPRRQVDVKAIVMPDPLDDTRNVEYEYRYEYDAEGNLERAEHPGNVVWFYEYDDRNRLERSGIEGTNVLRTVTYDLAGRVKTEDDNAEGRVEYQYYADGQVMSQTNPLGNVETFYYDARGDLDQVQDATRNAITRDYQRDALGRVTAVTDGNGHTRSVQLNGRGLTERTFVPNNPSQTRLSQQYDWRGNVVQEQDITGGERHYRFNAFGERIQATDAEGGVVDHEYDALGRKTKTVNAAGKVTLWVYDQQDNRLVVTQTETDPSFTQVRSARVRTSEKVYDLMGRLVAFIDAEQQQWQFEYNQQGLLTVTHNPDGSQLVNAYNAAGQLMSETATAAPGDNEPDRVTHYTRDAQGRVLTRQAPHYPSGVFDHYDYNGLGQPLTITLADLTTVTHQYDQAGRKTDTYYPANLTEHWDYDANDNPQAYTDRDGHRWEYLYNADNNRTWSFDPIAVANGLAYPGGQGTETHYDGLGRAVGTTDPLGNQQSVLLDTEGRVAHQHDAYGVAIVTERDSAGRPIAITDRNGATTEYQYNAFGDLEVVRDALGNATFTTYDRLGRATETTDALGNRVAQAYNHRAQVTASTDPLGHTTEQRYNGFGNLTAVARPGPQGPITSQYDWRADNRLTRVTPSAEQAPGQSSHYQYDALGRLTGQTNALNQHWSYQYNALGQVDAVSQPEAGTDLEYRYNGRGQLTERHYRDGADNRIGRFEYDPAGRLRHIDNAALSETYHYDPAGRLDAIDNHSLNQRFDLDHDANGRRTDTQATAEANLHYQRDAQGRIDRIMRSDAQGDDQSFDIHRDALGRVTQIDYPNQSRRSLEYDALGRISALHIEHLARTGRYRGQWETLESYQYQYDANGNLIQSE
ncbi:hypothetical protein, partial [Saccharospirillum sp.]|uniref:hypothetical protein n=1 Tax=Saccharospirillum sp. TaxID=2033801 RepID=UPI0034A068F7